MFDVWMVWGLGKSIDSPKKDLVSNNRACIHLSSMCECSVHISIFTHPALISLSRLISRTDCWWALRLSTAESHGSPDRKRCLCLRVHRGFTSEHLDVLNQATSISLSHVRTVFRDTEGKKNKKEGCVCFSGEGGQWVIVTSQGCLLEARLDWR